MDIRAPNTTRVLVVRALFKVQDEDRPVEFFSPPPSSSLSLSLSTHFFFLSSGKTRCTLRILCSVSFVPASSIACSSDHGTLQTIFPDFSYVPLPLLPRFLSRLFACPTLHPLLSPPFVFLCEQTWRRDGKFPMKTENSWLCAIGFQR